MLIDIGYFKGGLTIPNIEKDASGFENDYINKYEKEILVRLLGNTLYSNFMAGLAAPTIEQKWLDLRDGKDYTITINEVDYTIRWNGLINSEKESLIAYYVYFHWLQRNYHQLSGLGVIDTTTENATKVDPNEKLVWANNECAKLAGEYYHITLGYFEYTSFEPSLFNFIINNQTDYVGWVYTPLLPINNLGI